MGGAFSETKSGKENAKGFATAMLNLNYWCTKGDRLSDFLWHDASDIMVYSTVKGEVYTGFYFSLTRAKSNLSSGEQVTSNPLWMHWRSKDRELLCSSLEKDLREEIID